MISNWRTVAWLVAAFSCGLIDAAAWAILAAAWSLTSMRIEAMSPLVDKYAMVIGRVSAWGLFAGLAFAGNTMACGAAFAVGKVLAAAAARASLLSGFFARRQIDTPPPSGSTPWPKADNPSQVWKGARNGGCSCHRESLSSLVAEGAVHCHARRSEAQHLTSRDDAVDRRRMEIGY
jgi:hypothetical protein